MAPKVEKTKRITGLVLQSWQCACGATLRAFGPPLANCTNCGGNTSWSQVVHPAEPEGDD